MAAEIKFDMLRAFKGSLGRLRESLNDPTPLVKQLGALGVRASKKSFRDQKLGDHKWPARYEGMAPPFINIAGALSDFNAGRINPKPNRFQDRPALIGEGTRGGILASLTSRNRGKFEAEWGSNKSYAALHNQGGKSRINLTEHGKKLGRAWLFTENQKARKGRQGYVPKLWPSLFRGWLEQRVAKRPFLGIPDELAGDMIENVERYFRRRQTDGGASA